ncbi:O-methyltransferase, family 2 [Corchorus olitorius]|uniref:O-methyltransferase, family 2 n=1 Tax=Corchorus olitorius TaxID=93759 RepID=A0A1R3IQK4_9ROSI|nr:O-methyltransferase, family 2 [Corchorus olitorius]
MSLKCAVEPEIPDIIHNHSQPITISELALALSIHPAKAQSLYRLMRILVHFGFFAEHKVHEPMFNHLFNEAIASDGLLAANVVLSKCKDVFEGLKSLVNVGGGIGTLTKNLKYIGGDMFDKAPNGEAIMLKWILHDWNDEDCIKILKSCKEAIIGSKDKGEGKVIIMEMIVGNQEMNDSIEIKLYFDMEIMAICEGQERNEEEWSKLFADAGFSNFKEHGRFYHFRAIPSTPSRIYRLLCGVMWTYKLHIN